MLWTDIIDPATLSGYARASLADYEARRGTLARWLPNREIADIVARFVQGANGLVDTAKFRAYDAEPEVGKRRPGKRVTLELPALGQNIPVSEYEQLRARGGNVSDAQALAAIQQTTDAVVRAVADSIERLRGTVLVTGKATIAEIGADDDFGRSAGHTVVAPALWSVAGTDALGQIQGWCDTYVDTNGEMPGSIVMSTRAARALAKLDQMKTQLLNGASRPATLQDVNDTIVAAGLPPIELYDRRVQVDGVAQKVVSDDRVLLLPAPVATDDWMGTELGATFWGRTLTSTDSDWGIADAEQPGLVAGVYRNPKPPMGVEVIGDAIGMPVLANANLSFAADVL
ncbi:major capsid protein [Phycicoccus sp. 3266]|uniref:major capsid protein n=1 Tax=Phycicoccus sp. 3266 TaxID=2817751 RepID=UPI00285C7468|nr:major capsid protein [Phycicoccus sp. 3266]MDR6861968.1 hypothetical protein [Phycicoccus sp. 3266]